jgi:hypothetical protein
VCSLIGFFPCGKLFTVVIFITSMRRLSQVNTPWRIFLCFFDAVLFVACLRIWLAVSFDMLIQPGRRIGLCGDAPRAPTQRPGFGGSGRRSDPLPGILAIRRKIPGVWGRASEKT